LVREWIEIALATFSGIFPIANPFSTAVVFLGLTKKFSEAKKRRTILMACIYMTGTLVVFLIAGEVIMRFFGLSLPGVKIAGGLIVARIGFGMLTPGEEDVLTEESQKESKQMDDISFTPLAMPMLSGPGCIAVTLGMGAHSDSYLHLSGIIGGIVLVALSAWIILRGAERVVKFMGKTGLDAMSRIMGFLLIAVGIQFLVGAIHDILSSPEFMQPIIKAIGF